MLKHKRFMALLLMVLTLLSMNIDSFVYADWTTSIYEEKKVTPIAKGVHHENILRFTDTGWLNINVLRISLTEPSTSLELLMGPNGLGEKSRLSDMVSTNPNLVGAINGDFFMTNTASTIGPMVKDGQLIGTPSSRPEQLGTFNLSKDNLASIAPWVSIRIDLKGKTTPFTQMVGLVNKESDYNGVVIAYTPHWGAKAPAPQPNVSNPMYVVVENDVVTEISPATSEGKAIPANGYVVLTTSSGSSNVSQNLLLGDEVEFSYMVNPDLNNLQLTLGGGGVLVRNGAAVSAFTHEITGIHPRTAIGVSQNRQEVFFVTIDGRTASYTGVSQKDLANIMVYLGAFEAMNLDGGGSTEMILRPLGESNRKIVNNLSDGGERRLMNGIGVVSNAPAAELGGIQLSAADTNVFVNTSRDLTLKAFDKNYNPFNLDPSQVSWQVSGVEGTVQGNTFRPASPGKATLTASYNGISSSLQFHVLANPVALQLSPATLTLGANSTHQIQAVLVNQDGYRASIHPRELSFTIPSNLGSVDSSGIFRASGQGSSGLIQANYGSLTAYQAAVIGHQDRIIGDFETLMGTFTTFPAEVKGSYELSSIAKAGNSSGKLSFDFTTTNATRAAYILFNNGGIQLDQRPSKLGMWVFGNEGGGHWLRGKLVDADGTAQTVDFSSNVNWDGWKYVEAAVPGTMKAPIKLERIYMVETRAEAKNAGSILIDQLTASYPIAFQGTIPAVPKPQDSRNIKAETKGDNSFRFFAHGMVSGIDTLQDTMAVTKMAEISNGTAQFNLFTGSIDATLSKALKSPVVLGNSGNAATKHKDSLFIKLDNNKGGLRETNVQQWSWFLQTMANQNAKSLFIVLPKALSFKDPLEEKLFKDTLKNAKENKGTDIWVFTPGNGSFSVTPEDGIRYVSLKAFPQNNDYDIFTQLPYMLFTVNGDQVTYEILPMYTK